MLALNSCTYAGDTPDHPSNPISGPLLPTSPCGCPTTFPHTHRLSPSGLSPLASAALRQWEEEGELLLPLTFLLLVLGSLLLYLAVSLMDPGYVNIQPQVTGEGGGWPEPLLPPQDTQSPKTVSCQIPFLGHLSASSHQP